MAINNQQIFKPGQKLTPEQLKQMLELAQNDQRSGSMPGKFGPQIVFDPRQVQRGTSVGADAEYMNDPSGAGRQLITQARNASNFGGNDITDVWDQEGNYLGTSSGMGDLRGLATIAAMAAGGAYFNGGFGDPSGAAATAAGTTGSGTLSAAEQSLLSGGGYGTDLATLTGGSPLTSGAGLNTFGTTIADAGLLSEVAGGVNIATAAAGGAPPGTPTTPGSPNGTPPTTTPPPGTTPPPAANALTAADLLKLAKPVAGITAAIVGGDALSDPVDTSKWDQLFDNMLSEQSLASQRGRDLWADYTTTFKPAQQKFVDTAMNYDTAPRRESAAQDASGRVASAYDEQRMSAQREMERAGVDPSTIYALGVSSRLNQAKDEAAAENNARTDVEKTGLNLIKGVVDQGNQVVNQSTQQSNIVTGTGNSASGILNSQANQQNQNTQNRNGMISDLLTTGAMVYGMTDKKDVTSSKKSKDRGGKVDGLAAVKAVEKSPAEHWRYKPGQGDGSTQQRMGPMAEDLKKAAPQVSDGKKVDMIALVGLQHAAIGGLSKRLAGIEKKLGGLSDARRKAA